MAGYSGTPLPQKLGIKSGTTVVLINEPANYRKLLGDIPDQVRLTNRTGANPNFVHLFTTSRRELEDQIRRLRDKLAQDGTLWISWPKKSSGVPTDITEDTIRQIALPVGF